MGKRYKAEVENAIIDQNKFFKNDKGETEYNILCKTCRKRCKQSFRAVIINCNKRVEK